MWMCIRCAAELSVDDAPPNMDDLGLHFMCPHCGRRNRLQSLGYDSDDLLMLAQIDPPEYVTDR